MTSRIETFIAFRLEPQESMTSGPGKNEAHLTTVNVGEESYFRFELCCMAVNSVDLATIHMRTSSRLGRSISRMPVLPLASLPPNGDSCKIGMETRNGEILGAWRGGDVFRRLSVGSQ